MSEKRKLTAAERRVLKTLKDKIRDIKGGREMIRSLQGMTSEDHSLLRGSDDKKREKKLLEERKELDAQTKSAKKLIKRVKAGSLVKGRGGGGGGGTGPVRTMLKNLQATVHEDRKKF